MKSQLRNKMINKVEDFTKPLITIKSKLPTQPIKHNMLFFLLVLSIIGCKSNNIEAPSGLTVETIREPKTIGIIDRQPEFSWLVPTISVSQRGYQILVSSSMENSKANVGDLWDSGHVLSSTNVNAEYQGVNLTQDQTCFWKVRIWGVDDEVSHYSEPQQFTIADGNKLISSSNLFQIEKIKPSDSYTTDSLLFLDFGKDAFATLELNYTPLQPETLLIRLGEKLLNGAIDQKPGGSIRYSEVSLPVAPNKSIYQIELTPNVRNTKPQAVALPDSFPVLTPFRYCEIVGKQKPAADQVEQIAYFNYFDDQSNSFSSSDSILNQVWELCKYSIKATTFTGLYVDGDRERIPYEADAYLNQLSHYAVDHEYAIARRTIEYFMEHPTWPTEWQQHVALMFYEDYMYTGNTELIEKYYDRLKYKTLYELAREDGLISSHSEKNDSSFMKKLGFNNPKARLKDIVDWPQTGGYWDVMGETDGFEFLPINTVVNSFYCENLRIMSVFAKILGKTDEALAFEGKMNLARASLNELLFDEEKGIYIDGEGSNHASLHANMMPLAFNLVPQEHISSVAAFVKSRGMACSVYGAQYLLDGLYNAGEQEYALQLMTATHDRSWWNMINIGSTITLEAWDTKYKPNLDWNHAWGAVPANVVIRGMWGIKPKTPSFSQVSIRPQLGDLTACTVTTPTIRGAIKCKYAEENQSIQRYEVELPGNMTGDFYVSNLDTQNVTLNGEKLESAVPTIALKPGINVIELK